MFKRSLLLFPMVWLILPLFSCSNPLGSNAFTQYGFLSPSSNAYCSGSLLTNTPYAKGSGISSDPYVICTATQLNTIGTRVSDWSANFVLQSNIDLTAVSYNVIGTTSTHFTGTFDGNGFVVSNLILNSGPGDIGFFGWIGSAGMVKNLGVENAVITGTGYYVGVLAGQVDGTVTHSHATGSVSGNGSNIGGLVGSMSGTGQITTSYAKVVLAATGSEVGGFIGSNSGVISNCYAITTTSLSGLAHGGFSGLALAGSISNSYAVGAVGTGGSNSGCFVGFGNSIGSYYNNTVCTIGLGTGDTASGLSTTSMQTAASFAGWGTTIWNFQASQYPTLF
jgi:hypothetical protein